MEQKERLACGKHQFPNRDRHKASPLASPQQPVDHVFLRGLTPPKSCRPLLSHADHNANRFYGHRRTTEPREFLWIDDPPVIPRLSPPGPLLMGSEQGAVVAGRFPVEVDVLGTDAECDRQFLPTPAPAVVEHRTEA